MSHSKLENGKNGFGRYYHVLNSRLALTKLAILNTWKILLYILNKISLQILLL